MAAYFKTFITIFSLLLLLFIIQINCQDNSGKPFTIDQLHDLKRLGAPSVSPDGTTVVFTLTHWNSQTNVTTTNLEIKTLKDPSSIGRHLTYKEGASDSSPVFSADGRWIAFLSSRSGSSQVWVVPISGQDSDAKQLTSLPLDLSNLRWSPTGNFITFTADVYPSCTTIQCTVDQDAQIASRGQNTGYTYTSLYVRHWDVFETKKASHIFKQPVVLSSNTWKTNGAAVDLMYLMSAASPVPPFGGAEQYGISPDGSEVAFTAEIINSQTAWTTGWVTYVVSTSSGSPRSITNYTNARTQNPIYSPNGQMIAYAAMDRPGYEADRLHLVIYYRSSGQTKNIAYNWDRSVIDIVWTTDNSALIVTSEEDGRKKLFIVNINDQSVNVLVEDGAVTGPVTRRLSGATDDIVIFARDSLKYPIDIWWINLAEASNSTPVYRSTNYNSDALNGVFFSQPQRWYFENGGDMVQGWLLRPIGWNNSAAYHSYPVALLIHGGPEDAWIDSWSYRWNPQLWASHGYAVISINPHGSTGYGQAFQDAVNGNWGGLPFQDIMTGVDFALANFPWMDPNRVGACGASYGGYMINWINGHTNRFKALVCHDGMFDTYAGYFETDELWFPEWEFLGTPWTPGSVYEKWNPRNYVSSWQTPTLVIHGGRDFRLPLTQGLSAFTSLQRQNIPSKLLFFPEENHWVLNQRNSIMWYNEVLGWLDQWTKKSN
eukprot:TRINITY_DN448_c0_g1_i1.p1 TRINITY_DN448_c0_g1~~TRINITY_DN448_c0_g1_i1.p1  ORF type:complete len:727 (+),score=357.62 TRINITY_DN448_c0_g1_i1:43-2181(+)